MKISKNYKAIIFDMDGVLLDTETICDKTWEITAKELNLPYTYSIIQECRGTNKNDTRLILKKHFGQAFDSDKFLELTSSKFHKIEEEQGISLMPFARQSLTLLSKKYPLLLASSTRGPTVERQLKNAGLYDFFKTFTTGDLVKHSKPDPEIYNLALQSLNLKPEDCCAVEDSPNGIKSAHAAKIDVFMIPDKIAPTPEITKLTTSIFKNLEEFTKAIL